MPQKYVGWLCTYIGYYMQRTELNILSVDTILKYFVHDKYDFVTLDF